MTSPQTTPPRAVPLRLLRELLALVLLIGGVITLGVIAFDYSPQLGWTAIGSASIATGVILSRRSK